jgi:hypothetical protein
MGETAPALCRKTRNAVVAIPVFGKAQRRLSAEQEVWSRDALLELIRVAVDGWSILRRMSAGLLFQSLAVHFAVLDLPHFAEGGISCFGFRSDPEKI